MNGLAKKVAVLVGLVGLGVLAAACSSSSSGSGSTTPCNENPFVCPSTQTCWVETDGMTFDCLNEGTGAAGGSCMAIAGEPQCGAGLFCLQTTATSGTCLQFCEPNNPAHACPGNGACEEAAFNADMTSPVYLCAPTTTPPDSGTTPPDSGTTPADAGAHEAATD